MVNAANFGDKLFDMETDPHQRQELHDAEIEAAMANILQRAMIENDCPIEQFERIGIAKDRQITKEDIERLHEMEKKSTEPDLLPQYQWTKGAVNIYHALMKFIPKEEREKVIDRLEEEIPGRLCDGQVVPDSIWGLIPLVIAEEFVDMVQYFVGLSGRTS